MPPTVSSDLLKSNSLMGRGRKRGSIRRGGEWVTTSGKATHITLITGASNEKMFTVDDS